MKHLFKTIPLLGICTMLIFANCGTKEKNIGLQLYSLRDDIHTLGIEKVLEEVADIGYKTIELAGYQDGLFYGYTPEEFKKLAETKGLKISSSSAVRLMSNNSKADSEYWEQAIEAHRKLGVRYIVMPMPPFNKEDSTSLEDVDKVCNYFNSIGEKATNAGLKFCFHNHDHEFIKNINGRPIYNLMLEKLNPNHVFMQMDVYWVIEAGYSPEEYLKNYMGRFPLLHIKDEKAVGASGTINFESIFETAYQTGVETYFVEVEWYDHTPLEEVKRSFNYLNESKFVK